MKNIFISVVASILLSILIGGLLIGYLTGYNKGQTDSLRNIQKFKIEVKYQKKILNFSYKMKNDTTYTRSSDGTLLPWIDHTLIISDTNFYYVPIDTIFLRKRTK
jgi:hypothetical protein